MFITVQLSCYVNTFQVILVSVLSQVMMMGKRGGGLVLPNRLPLYISSLLSFEGSWVCTSFMEINYFKAVDVTR